MRECIPYLLIQLWLVVDTRVHFKLFWLQIIQIYEEKERERICEIHFIENTHD